MFDRFINGDLDREETIHNPDFYGPSWICTTLILVVATLGKFVGYITHKKHHKHLNYDINQVTWLAGLFYGCVPGIPLAVHFVLNYFSVLSDLVNLWCLYGYSIFVYITASYMFVIILEIFRWVVVGVAGFVSTTFLSINLRSHIKTASEKWFFIV
jgi:sensor histidine kinase YesM